MLVERQPAWQADDTDLEALCLEFASSLEGDADFTARADDSQVLLLLVVQHVTTTSGFLDGRAFEIGQVLTGEGEYGGGSLGLESDKVGGGGLISVSWAPESNVGGCTEGDGCFDGLMRRSIFTEADRVMCG